MLRKNSKGHLPSTNRRSIRAVSPIVTCCLAFLSNVSVAAQASEPTKTEKNERCIESLFTGRDFQGWIQSGNWKCADNAFYCSRVTDDRNDLRYTKKIPRDCEISFEWKQGRKIKSEKQMNPGFGIRFNSGDSGVFRPNPSGGVRIDYDGPFRPNSSYGASIDYYFSGIQIRLHTRDLDDDSPLDRKYDSRFLSKWPTKDFSRPRGEWNQSRITVRGPEIQFWLNGNKVYDIDLKSKVIKHKGGEEETINKMNLALDEWLRRGKDGVYLSVTAPQIIERVAAHVQIRSLTISFERGAAPGDARGARGQAGSRY